MFKTFVKAGEIVEAEQKGSDRIRVSIKVSTDKVDQDGDRILLKAWENPEDQQWFLDKGVLDYNHLSVLLKPTPARIRAQRMTPAQIAEASRESAAAIIGEPLRLEVSDGLYCTGELYATNSYVREVLPALRSGSSRYGASAGGGFFQPSQMTKSSFGERTYDRARLHHIAVCPLAEAKNDETSISLLKSVQAGLADGEPTANAELATPLADEPQPLSLEAMVKGYVLSRSDFKDFLIAQIQQQYSARSADQSRLMQLFQDMGLNGEEAREFANITIAELSRSA